MQKQNKSDIAIQPTSELSREMAIAIEAWLNYNSSVCGKIGVQENMINHPIKAFSVFHQNEFDIQFERQHPYLSSKCHVDLHIQLKNNKKTKTNKEYYFEFKQAKDDTAGSNERSRIFYDIARLSSLASKNCRCFFLIFGTDTSFKRCFLNYSMKRQDEKQQFKIREHGANEQKDAPFYSRWFILDNSDGAEKEIDIYSDDLYSKFKKEYLDAGDLQNRQKAIPPRKIITKRIYISSQDKLSYNEVGVWEILRVK